MNITSFLLFFGGLVVLLLWWGGFGLVGDVAGAIFGTSRSAADIMQESLADTARSDTAADVALPAFELDVSHTASDQATATVPAAVVPASSWLTPEQAAFLERIGVPPASLPTKLTPEQIECMTRALGEDRIGALLAGGIPSFTESMKALRCL